MAPESGSVPHAHRGGRSCRWCMRLSNRAAAGRLHINLHQRISGAGGLVFQVSAGPGDLALCRAIPHERGTRAHTRTALHPSPSPNQAHQAFLNGAQRNPRRGASSGRNAPVASGAPKSTCIHRNRGHGWGTSLVTSSAARALPEAVGGPLSVGVGRPKGGRGFAVHPRAVRHVPQPFTCCRECC